MSLKVDIPVMREMSEDLKEAMKKRQGHRVSTFRFIQSALKNREIALRPKPLDEREVYGVLKQLCKQRRDSVEQFEKAGRMDLVAKEQEELDLIENYLPPQMTENQIRSVVEKVIQDLGASSPKDMGVVMKGVLGQIQGGADNKLVNRIVQSLLL